LQRRQRAPYPAPHRIRAYLSLTEDALWKFGIRFAKEGNIYFIPGNQCYRATSATVEGDYSNAAFFHSFLLFGDEVNVTGLPADSHQSDAAYLKMFPALAAGIPTLDISQCPDLGPILMALAAAKK
jgi:3-phosphoshikimate 1-carboxyvinyltransferase